MKKIVWLLIIFISPILCLGAKANDNKDESKIVGVLERQVSKEHSIHLSVGDNIVKLGKMAKSVAIKTSLIGAGCFIVHELPRTIDAIIHALDYYNQTYKNVEWK